MPSSHMRAFWQNSCCSTSFSSSPSSGKRYVSKQDMCRHRRKKTSIEDLAEQGFEIGNLLGEGSYCKVKSATYNGNDIAVKVITRDHLSIDFESKFLPREIDALGKVKHMNIIHIYKIFSYPRRVYVFMELASRGDLLYYIRNQGRIMNDDGRYFFRQMISAMKYLHSLNIAHRDLKCENIMITGDNVIKVIDFGFCRPVVNESGKRVLSKTYCGSTAYASPEVLQGVPYNPIMYDVWSLGCVLFIMMTGTMPFNDSNIRYMVMCQLQRKIGYPTTFEVDIEVKTLISRMLEPDVTRRATMNQISQSPWLKNSDSSENDNARTNRGSTDEENPQFMTDSDADRMADLDDW